LRHGAALQARSARQIGARNRLAGPDQFQHNIAIDAPRGFAGGELDIGQVDMANAAHVPVGLVLFGISGLRSGRAIVSPATIMLPPWSLSNL
jgi:hypothetical protein